MFPRRLREGTVPPDDDTVRVRGCRCARSSSWVRQAEARTRNGRLSCPRADSRRRRQLPVGCASCRARRGGHTVVGRPGAEPSRPAGSDGRHAARAATARRDGGSGPRGRTRPLPRDAASRGSPGPRARSATARPRGQRPPRDKLDRGELRRRRLTTASLRRPLQLRTALATLRTADRAARRHGLTCGMPSRTCRP